MARIRSPNYPALSLAEAVKRISMVFERDRQHPMPKSVVMKGMGYGGINGASLAAISAVLKYGLLESAGDDYRVSDRAVAILHPHSPQEKAEALAAAARAPALFAELLEQYSGAQVSDDNLRAYLIRRGFAQSALSPVIQSYRETMALVSESDQTYDSQEEQPEGPRVVEAVGQIGGRPNPSPPPAAATSSPYKVSMSDGRLDIAAALVDQETARKLMRVIEANITLLPEKPAKPSDADEASSR